MIVTGVDPIPTEICGNRVLKRQDLRTTHEEADVIITQQVVHLAKAGKQSICVVADDTDVFVLLLYFYKTQHLNCSMTMIGTSSGRKCVDIKATVHKCSATIEDIPPAHVLSGFYTVSCLWGIGKGTVLKVPKAGMVSLDKLGNPEGNLDDIKSQAASFIAACYGIPAVTDMTALRYRIWTSKMGNHKLNSAPQLRVLQPTTEAFEEHVSRAHLQTAIWLSALDAEPPKLDRRSIHYGWSINDDTHKLEPVGLPADVSPAPISVLKLIKRGCSSSQPCSSTCCSCSTAGLSCSVFCACHGTEECKNTHTITAVRAEEYDEDDGDIS